MAGRSVLQTSVGVAAGIAAAIAGLFVLAVLAMTQPSIATPVTRTAISMTTGQAAGLDSARLRLGWPLGFSLRGLTIEGEVAPTEFAEIDGRANPFGFLPGVAFLPSVETREGALSARLGGGQSSGNPPAWLDEIGRVAAEDITIALAREGEAEPDIFVIDTAEGRPPAGELNLVGRGGGATVFFDGGLAGPLGRGVEGAVTIRGDNLATFADLLGLAAPDTPPYELNARLSSGPDLWRLGGLTGTVGDSDIAGDVEARLGGERPFIDADLTSETLDFDDLGILVGAPTQVDGEEANELQRQTNAAFAASDRLIPDADLDLTRVRAVDAELDFRADSVRAGGFPMEAVTVHMTLQDGVMRFDPLDLAAAQGHLRATITIDASGDRVTTQAEGQVDGVQIGDMAAGRIGRGELEGQFALSTEGQNLRAAAAAMNGSAALWAREAAIRSLAEEGADLDIGEAVFLLISEEPENPELSPLHCGVARFDVENGVATAAPVVFDSDDSTLAMEGAVDFTTEALALDIDADNKDFSWGEIFGDIKVQGTLRRPAVTPELGPAVAQGGIAALLGALAGPLAALPFFNLEEGEDAPCQALMARAQAAPEVSEP